MTPQFVVLNKKDIEIYLSDEQKAFLSQIEEEIKAKREADGKLINDYYVCNQDEPYATVVIRTIIEGEMEKRGVY